MRLVVLWSLALTACSFEHGKGASIGTDRPDAPWSGQAADAPLGVDAQVAPVDTPCADDDGDGVCNGADTWPCGAEPAAPSATVAFTGNNGQTSTTITSVNLDNTGTLAVATSQENLSLTLHYDVQDTACQQACIDQVEIGWEPGGRTMCVFDDAVSKQTGVANTVSVTIRAPQAKNVYDLRVNLGQNYSCGTSKSWWGGTPGATRTIAKLCVH
ncbi:MAG TPA: hypothetical protein VIV40_05490 [Kofleriaceae bacterium]